MKLTRYLVASDAIDILLILQFLARSLPPRHYDECDGIHFNINKFYCIISWKMCPANAVMSVGVTGAVICMSLRVKLFSVMKVSIISLRL